MKPADIKESQPGTVGICAVGIGNSQLFGNILAIVDGQTVYDETKSAAMQVIQEVGSQGCGSSRDQNVETDSLSRLDNTRSPPKSPRVPGR